MRDEEFTFLYNFFFLSFLPVARLKCVVRRIQNRTRRFPKGFPSYTASQSALYLKINTIMFKKQHNQE